MATEYDELEIRAAQIRDETQVEANSASRVGQFLLDFLEYTSNLNVGGGGAPFSITPTENDGGIVAGQTYTDVTSEDLWRLKLVRYQTPGFAAFQVAGQSSQDVEVGTSFAAGFKSFTWATSNPQNVTANSITIRDVTANTNLATGEANDGAASISTASLTATVGEFKRYRISGTNSQGGSFSADVVYSGYNKIFYGTGAALTSAAARALSGQQLTSQGNSFTLNTGTSATQFTILVPPGKALGSVIDQDAANTPITGDYVAQATISVNNAAGVAVPGYTPYLKTQSASYGINHRHYATLQ